MLVYDKFLGRHRLEPVIGMSSLVAMVLCIAHFFIDVLLLTSYHHAQSDFQRLYLCLHFGFLVLTMLVLVYGFSALSKATYHSVSNLRSWTLFCGLFLFCAGFFSTIGFSLDWLRFRDECLANSRRSAHSDDHSDATHQVELSDAHACRSTWTALLVTHAMLWSVMMVALGILFFSVNSYKNTHFADEEAQRLLRHREELRKRNRRLRRQRHERKRNVRTDDEDDDEDDVEVQEEKEAAEELDRLDEKTMQLLAERLAVAALAATNPISDSSETLTAQPLHKYVVDPDHIQPSPRPTTAYTAQPRIPDESRRIYALNRDMPHAKQNGVTHLAVPKIVVDRASQHGDSESETSSPPTSGHGFLSRHHHHHHHRAPRHSQSPAMMRSFTRR